MLQNHIGELEKKPKKRKFVLLDIPIHHRLLITIPQLLILLFIFIFFLVHQAPRFTNNSALFIQVPLGLGIILLAYFIYRRVSYHKNEHIHQQKKYYAFGNVKPTSTKQLEALQLIAFSRYIDGFWTDTLEHSPAEVRVEHIPNFRKKLDYFKIKTKEELISEWADAWGMISKTKYEKLYSQLLNGLHTSQFLLDYKDFPEWKTRVLELTEISEDYFDSCFNTSSAQPQKLIWAWDLWRAVLLSTAAFECGFISEEKAWKDIYKASDLSHFLFDSIDDFYTNMRLGHAYWCNNEKQVFERTSQVNAFLNPKTGNERLVHTVNWTPIKNIDLPHHMADNFKSFLKDIDDNNTPNKIGFNKNQ